MLPVFTQTFFFSISKQNPFLLQKRKYSDVLASHVLFLSPELASQVLVAIAFWYHDVKTQTSSPGVCLPRPPNTRCPPILFLFKHHHSSLCLTGMEAEIGDSILDCEVSIGDWVCAIRNLHVHKVNSAAVPQLSRWPSQR